MWVKKQVFLSTTTTTTTTSDQRRVYGLIRLHRLLPVSSPLFHFFFSRTCPQLSVFFIFVAQQHSTLPLYLLLLLLLLPPFFVIFAQLLEYVSYLDISITLRYSRQTRAEC